MICRLDGIWTGQTSRVLLATAIETILTLKSMIPGSQTVGIWYCPDLLSNVALGLRRLCHERIPTNRTYRVFIFGRRICWILHGVMCTLDCHLLDLSEGRSIDRVHWFLAHHSSDSRERRVDWLWRHFFLNSSMCLRVERLHFRCSAEKEKKQVL